MSQRRCVDCQRPSPETNTSYTLISSKHGWRLTRVKRPNGELEMQWRCPDCWVKFRDSTPSQTLIPARKPASLPPRGASVRPRTSTTPSSRADAAPPRTPLPPRTSAAPRPSVPPPRSDLPPRPSVPPEAPAGEVSSHDVGENPNTLFAQVMKTLSGGRPPIK